MLSRMVHRLSSITRRVLMLLELLSACSVMPTAAAAQSTDELGLPWTVTPGLLPACLSWTDGCTTCRRESLGRPFACTPSLRDGDAQAPACRAVDRTAAPRWCEAVDWQAMGRGCSRWTDGCNEATASLPPTLKACPSRERRVVCLEK